MLLKYTRIELGHLIAGLLDTRYPDPDPPDPDPIDDDDFPGPSGPPIPDDADEEAALVLA